MTVFASYKKEYRMQAAVTWQQWSIIKGNTKAKKETVSRGRSSNTDNDRKLSNYLKI